MRAAAKGAPSARGSQTPSYGYPARLRKSTHDFQSRTTRDGRRDPRALGAPLTATRPATHIPRTYHACESGAMAIAHAPMPN